MIRVIAVCGRRKGHLLHGGKEGRRKRRFTLMCKSCKGVEVGGREVMSMRGSARHLTECLALGSWTNILPCKRRWFLHSLPEASSHEMAPPTDALRLSLLCFELFPARASCSAEFPGLNIGQMSIDSRTRRSYQRRGQRAAAETRSSDTYWF